MSADELYHRARQVDDPALADRLAARAILADPDHALAYALRGHLAARRGDPIVAAHYFRVAYTRGDRADATRAALAACLDAAGEHAVADRLRADAALPPELADFAEGLAHHGPVLRQILSTRLPPAGQPALLPGEKPPSDEVAARDDALVARMAPARRSPLGSERPADHRPPPARVARPPLPSGAGRELDAEPERPPLPGRT
ncbi:MAG: hypothetical protein H6703_16105, partial [Myxococcales bacterium]|nr:hypothetical protein [Myxococcales bacterium]